MTKETNYDYQTEIEVLNSVGYKVDKSVYVSGGEMYVEELRVVVSPILAVDEMKKIRLVIGKGYKITFAPNSMEIIIKKFE
jgi:hypothetical protein